MGSAPHESLETDLYRRHARVAAWSRVGSVAFAGIAAILLRDAPGVRLVPAFVVGGVYLAFALAAAAWRARRGPSLALGVVHDVVDAFGVALGALCVGALDGPLWLLLYPHVVGVSLRRGLRYALAIGALDAGLLVLLAVRDPDHPLHLLHAFVLLFCAFLGGAASTHLRRVRARLDGARERLEKQADEWQALNAIGRGILERLDLEELLPLVTRSVNQLMGTHFCLLMLVERDELVPAAVEGLEAEVVNLFRGMRVGESLTGWVALHGEPLVLSDMRKDPRMRFPKMLTEFGYRAFLCVPLKRSAEVLGTLEVVTKQARAFSAEEQALLCDFAAVAAIALDHARLFAETRSNLATVEATNRRLEELDRLRQEYLRNVSHEFRTPLTVIKGYAEYLRDAPVLEDESTRQALRVMVESSDRLMDLVDTLLSINRLEGPGGVPLQLGAHDLADVVATALAPLRPLAQRRNVALQVSFPPQALRIVCDGGLLEQAVRKLVDNAIKYSPGGAAVRVAGAEDGGCLVLRVEDAGIGIAPEHHERIFDKFFMIDGSISRRVGGTGVGLYLVREIARLHQGSVRVASAPGRGSCFELRLPRLAAGRGELPA